MSNLTTHNLDGALSNCCAAPHNSAAEFSILNEVAIGWCSLCQHPAQFFAYGDADEGNDMTEFDGDQTQDDTQDDTPEPIEDEYLDSAWEDRAELVCW